MPSRKFALNQTHGYIGDKPKSKAAPREILDASVKAYWYKRDMVMLNDMFTDNETKEAIRLKYGL